MAERVSLKSENLLENETNNFNDQGDISDADVESNAKKSRIIGCWYNSQ